ncbi:hypothetical protein Hypma_013859 [Hypsizygus marmoreus]|uniref:Uncharacterized protein n=1 Tax=Hypsizygus marmoreus TaxID=39966 RepID=A0A369KDH1_HYPMA|nr:hypothetical protein Hypma_013859 [Hypsizygus marmoreus]
MELFESEQIGGGPTLRPHIPLSENASPSIRRAAKSRAEAARLVVAAEDVSEEVSRTTIPVQDDPFAPAASSHISIPFVLPLQDPFCGPLDLSLDPALAFPHGNGYYMTAPPYFANPSPYYSGASTYYDGYTLPYPAGGAVDHELNLHQSPSPLAPHALHAGATSFPPFRDIVSHNDPADVPVDVLNPVSIHDPVDVPIHAPTLHQSPSPLAPHALHAGATSFSPFRDIVSHNDPADVPVDVLNPVSIHDPIDVPIHAPTDVPVDVRDPVSIHDLADVPIHASADVPVDGPVDVPIDVRDPVPIHDPADVPVNEAAILPKQKGRPTNASVAATSAFIDGLDAQVKEFSDIHSIPVETLMDRFFYCTTHTRTNRQNTWNLYQPFFIRNSVEEVQAHLEYIKDHPDFDSPSKKLKNLEWNMQPSEVTAAHAYTTFEARYPDGHQELLETHRELILTDGVGTTKQQRERAYRKFESRLVRIAKEASTVWGFETVLGLCGNVVHQDTGMSTWFESQGAQGFMHDKLLMDTDSITGHLKSTVHQNISLRMISDAALARKLNIATNGQASENHSSTCKIGATVEDDRKAGEYAERGWMSSDDGERHDEGSEEIDDTNGRATVMYPDFEAKLKYIRVTFCDLMCAAGAKGSSNQLLWLQLAWTCLIAGVRIIDWPEGVQFPGVIEARPGGHDNATDKKGIKQLSQSEVILLFNSLVAGRGPRFIKDHTGARAATLGKVPAIVGRMPSYDSEHKFPRRLFFLGKGATPRADRGPSPAVPPDAASPAMRAAPSTLTTASTKRKREISDVDQPLALEHSPISVEPTPACEHGSFKKRTTAAAASKKKKSATSRNSSQSKVKSKPMISDSEDEAVPLRATETAMETNSSPSSPPPSQPSRPHPITKKKAQPKQPATEPTDSSPLPPPPSQHSRPRPITKKKADPEQPATEPTDSSPLPPPPAERPRPGPITKKKIGTKEPAAVRGDDADALLAVCAPPDGMPTPHTPICTETDEDDYSIIIDEHDTLYHDDGDDEDEPLVLDRRTRRKTKGKLVTRSHAPMPTLPPPRLDADSDSPLPPIHAESSIVPASAYHEYPNLHRQHSGLPLGFQNPHMHVPYGAYYAQPGWHPAPPYGYPAGPSGAPSHVHYPRPYAVTYPGERHSG